MITKDFQCLILFFLFAHSWTVYQCTLNVLIFHSLRYTLIVLTLSLRTFQFTSCTVSHGRRHILWRPDICQNVFIDIEKNNDQNVFMWWYSMVYLSYTVCVFCFPRSWWGWLAGVFMKSLCNINMKIQSCWLIYLVFFLCCWSVLPPEVYLVMFSLYCYVLSPSFLLGHNQPRGVLLEKTWVEIQLGNKNFSLGFNQIHCVKSTNQLQMELQTNWSKLFI